MPFSPCFKRKYCKPCKCSSPRECNCECIRPSLPPITEDDDSAPVQLYTPVIAATPVSKKCCCCEVKPKKSFWQQLFGDRKCCCTPNHRKKPDCLCKQKKKPRFVTECTNLPCYSENKQRAESRNNPTAKPFKPLCLCKNTKQPCKPLCCCKKLKPCKCKPSYKPSCPSPESSIFGCHFYCNVGNWAKNSRRRCCCCCDQSLTETTDCTTEDERLISICKYSTCTCTCTSSKEVLPKKPPVSPPQEPPPPSNVDKPTLSNIHIGLTLTNTETKYYKNNNACPPIEEETICNNNEQNEGSSSEQIITLEIHQSDDDVNKGKNGSQENSRNRDEGSSSMNSSKRRKPPPLQEDNEKYARNSVNYSQEMQLEERKNNQNKNINENINGTVTSSKGRRTNNSVMIDSNAIDARVSEILRRLRTIENKINNIDSNRTEKKTFENGSEANKNAISVYLKKDGQHYDSYENYNSNSKKNGRNSRKPDAVIEIRKTRSKSYSPYRYDSSTQLSKYRYSRSLDRGSRSHREKPKVIIKFPHGNKISEGFFSVASNKKVKNVDYRDSEWMEISNKLKSSTQMMSTSCYCYDCVCKRIMCM